MATLKNTYNLTLDLSDARAVPMQSGALSAAGPGKGEAEAFAERWRNMVRANDAACAGRGGVAGVGSGEREGAGVEGEGEEVVAVWGEEGSGGDGGGGDGGGGGGGVGGERGALGVHDASLVDDAHQLHDARPLDGVADGDAYVDGASDFDDDEVEDVDEESNGGDLVRLNYFVHNGYRYDGDIFQLRPPQERSMGSRPQRILEHKPPLLSHCQNFNRVYSEGTYNARPLSLRQLRRQSSRFSSSSMASLAGSEAPSEDSEAHPAPNFSGDPPGGHRPVTRPGSVRPPATSPLSPLSESVSRSTGNLGFTNGNEAALSGILAYSSVPVTKMSGGKPPTSPAKKTGTPATLESANTALGAATKSGALKVERRLQKDSHSNKSSKPTRRPAGGDRGRGDENHDPHKKGSAQRTSHSPRPRLVEERPTLSKPSSATVVVSPHLQASSNLARRRPFWKNLLTGR